MKECEGVLGRQSSFLGGTGPKANLLDPNNRNRGIQLTYYGGDLCLGLGYLERQVTYKLICDSATKLKFLNAFEERTCNYIFEMASKYACPKLTANAIPTTPSWGYGKTLCVSFILCLFLYFIIGAGVKRFAIGCEWKESVPHSEFWEGLPGLVTDGIRFVAGKIQGDY